MQKGNTSLFAKKKKNVGKSQCVITALCVSNVALTSALFCEFGPTFKKNCVECEGCQEQVQLRKTVISCFI